MVREQDEIAIRRELERYRGREVDTAGDGFLAVFDGPARAIRCAAASVGAVRGLGREIRARVHTGEVERLGTHVGGIAVHIGGRVAALAGPDEVLVSSTVRDLVAGVRRESVSRRHTHGLDSALALRVVGADDVCKGIPVI